MNTCTCEHTESCHVVDQLSDAKREIEILTSVVETQTKCIVKEQDQLTAATLEIDRINQVAEEELNEANGNMKKLQDEILRVTGELSIEQSKVKDWEQRLGEYYK